MIYPDYHVHSNLSFDGIHTVLEIAKSGVEKKLPELGFTEHLEFDPSNDAFGTYDYAKCREAVEEAQSVLDNRIQLRFGVEAGYEQSYEQALRVHFEKHPYDYVLGSVHSAQGLGVGRELFEKFPLEQAYRLYFEEVLRAVQSGLFDSMAHLDLPKRYGISFYGRAWDPEPFHKELQEILKAIIEMGMALEINTSGYRQDPHESYPGIETLELYHSLGGRLVTLGSDAHRSWDLASGFNEAGLLVRKLDLEVQHFGTLARPLSAF